MKQQIVEYQQQDYKFLEHLTPRDFINFHENEPNKVS